MFDLENSLDINSIDYFDVQNLSFDHPLSLEEIEDFRLTIFNLNNLSNIYFKGNIDIRTIEKIKDLLRMSSFIDDSSVEKIVTANLSSEDYKKFTTSSFENPKTWKVAYYKDGDNYLLTDIPRLRELLSYKENIEKQINEYSPFEKVTYLYDLIKTYELDNKKEKTLPEITESKITNQKGFNLVFSYLLNEFEIPNYIGRIKSKDEKISNITLAYIKDDKYKIDGLYLFEPTMDNLSKEEYRKNEVRTINYNYFGLKVDDINHSIFDDKLLQPLSIFESEDYLYSIEKMQNIRDKVTTKELTKLFKTFNKPYDFLYDRIWNSRTITFDDIEQSRKSIYINENDDFKKLVRENYHLRKEELFTPKTEEILEKLK